MEKLFNNMLPNKLMNFVYNIINNRNIKLLTRKYLSAEVIIIVHIQAITYPIVLKDIGWKISS